MALHWLVLFPLLAALAGYVSHLKFIRIGMFLTQSIVMALSTWLLYKVHHHGELVQVLGGYDRGIGITLFADRLSAVMVLLTAFLFSAMLLFNYRKHYMNRLFLFLYMLLQSLVIAIFLSGDLFNIYALIEVSTVIVSILIMYKKDNRSMYDGIVYLIANMVAMAFYLMGVGYLYKLFGTVDIAMIHSRIPLLADPSDLLLPFALIMTAVGLKSAVMPLFSWLPKAHGTPSAPSIVSALLSGLYVKTGLYLFIRMREMFLPALDASTLFLFLGVVTAVLGALLAISQTDIKLILAYSTVSQIGLILFSVNLGYEGSYWGGIYHIMNHAVFKSTLFLAAGILIENYGTRDFRQIRGVARTFPLVAAVMGMAMLGITGAPFFDGSLSKYMIQSGASRHALLEYVLVLINFGTILIFIRFSAVLFGKPAVKKPYPHPVTFNQGLSLSLLGLLTFLGSLSGLWIVRLIFGISVDISVAGYMEKSAVFLASLVAGLLFHRFLYPRTGIFDKFRGFELDINQIAFSIAAFFSGLLLILNLAY